MEKQEEVQVIKARSKDLREPLKADMANDEIFVSKDSIHILKHHGSYMQQNRDLTKKSDREKSYQFMLRLKVPVGEVPPQLYKKLDESLAAASAAQAQGFFVLLFFLCCLQTLFLLCCLQTLNPKP